MKPDGKWRVMKSIPLRNGGEIAQGNLILRVHGMYYLEVGGLLHPDYQQDFDMLISNEEERGWKYLAPERTIKYEV